MARSLRTCFYTVGFLEMGKPAQNPEWGVVGHPCNFLKYGAADRVEIPAKSILGLDGISKDYLSQRYELDSLHMRLSTRKPGAWSHRFQPEGPFNRASEPVLDLTMPCFWISRAFDGLILILHVHPPTVPFASSASARSHPLSPRCQPVNGAG